MRVLIAPDSFKGSLTAQDAAEAMARGVRAAMPEADIAMLPIADGGEGIIDVVLSVRGGERRRVEVAGPLGEPVEAEFALIDGGATAIVESAEAIGLTLLRKSLRDPMRTTSFGVGELIIAAADAGARRIVVGLGGSSTNDGGIGMAQALGIEIHGVNTPARGGDLGLLRSIDPSARHAALEAAEVVAACDVTNPLLGPTGATFTYGPQKGASREALDELEAGLEHLASLLPQIDSAAAGMGAAGGLGFGLAAFCGASIVSGADLVLDLIDVDRRLAGADLVLTGEGRMDGQSLHGKACIALAERAKVAGVPVIAMIGAAGEEIERVTSHGIAAWFSTCDGPLTEAQTMERAGELLECTTMQVLRVWLAGTL